MIKPITPTEAQSLKQTQIPDAVFDAFNQMIASEIDSNGQAVITQDEVIALICKKMGIDRFQVHMRWLDIENIYRNYGWEVEYDKPGYNESSSATFTFKQKESK